MNKRIVLLVAGAVLLVLLNMWKWWAAANIYNNADDSSETSGREEVHASQLVLIADHDKTSADFQVKRDIFKPVQNIKPATESVRQLQPPVHIPPQKTAEELEHEAAEIELSEYRCVGIAIHNGVTQAFLVRGDQNIVAGRGDRVSARFVVDHIEQERVVLIDESAGVTGVIRMTGK